MDLKNSTIISALIIFILSAFPHPASSQQQPTQDVPATSKGNMLFFVDCSGFADKAGKTYEEFYLMIPADQLHYTLIEGKNHGVIKIKVSLKDNSGKDVDSKQWTTETSLANDSVSTKTLAVYDQWGFGNLEPGVYHCSVDIADENSSNHAAASFDLNVPAFNAGGFSASQIEFVTRMEESTQKNQFSKGKISITPNPSRRFGILNPVLYMYYELYNLPDPSEGNLSVSYAIKAMDGHTVKSFPPIPIKKPGATASVFHGISVATVPSGIYDLNAVILDSVSNKSASITRRFEVMQFNQVKSQQQPGLTDEQAEIAGRIIKYIDPDKFRQYESLNLTGKTQYLIQFWKRLDPTPGTPENEYLERIQKLYQFANQNFGWGKEEGWATDRGRIVIKYGNPDEIEHHLFETGTVPYDVWIYEKNKTYIFVFADLQSNGRYTLIHSTKEREVNNPNWTELLKRL